VAVDRRAADGELRGDLRDGVLALAVPTGFVVHLPRQLDLARPELRFLSAGAAACASGDESVERRRVRRASVRTSARVLELCDRTEDVEEHPPHGG
jgi:hypothetical protein